MADTKLTKVCVACGKQKPLTAFLQLKNGEHGMYGSICSSCQKLEFEKAKIPPKDLEDETTSSTGFKIDSKSRVQEETDKRQHRQRIQEQDFEERKKKDEIRLEKIQVKETITENQKKHREAVLKTSLFSDKKSEAFQKAAIKQEQIQRVAKETHVQAHNAFEEKKRTTLDFSVPQAPREAGDLRYHNPTTRAFLQFLGTSAPLGDALAKAAKAQGKEAPSSEEFIEKNWGPSSRKR